MGRLFYYK